VGDMASDAEAAREAGCGFAAVAWGYAPAEALQALGPQRVLQLPAQIGTLLDAAAA